MESILTSIKKMLGIDAECDDFDVDIITHINSVLFIFKQIGVGPSKGFRITSDAETWNDFIPDLDEENLESLKTDVYNRVRLIFDPPTSSVMTQTIKESVSEMEWRLNVEAEDINFDREEDV